ncbi:MAG: anaerobic ribonucleoside-triphosphate reductase activating protein [Oscillospiraceae bacterium]|jgi:anaerobic ribonucleoside-triphosphate reductase activating protein|nr:anaerobic ribonucleoside-triphosphate reductase activating protein [Oscillospiraceae bacterium]
MRGTGKLRVAGRLRESIVDGPGLRYVIFTQGCPHRCEGCHNTHTWPTDGGEEAEPEALLAEMQADGLLRGVTFSGGEPFLQADALAALARRARALGLDVWVYTGYTWEELRAADDPAWNGLLAETDVLVDGRYRREERSYHRRFRGSANQRLIDVSQSLAGGGVVLWEA